MFYPYDPNKVVVIHGSLLLDGFAEGSMVTVSKSERDFAMDPGAKGDVVLRRLRNPIGTITVRLQAESPSNTALALLREQNTKGIPVPVPTIVRDLQKNALHKAAFSIVEGAPDSEYASDSGVREWVFLCATLESFVAGAIVVA